MKRTPLRRTAGPSRRTPLAARTPIRQRSARQRQVDADRGRLRERLRAERGDRCQAAVEGCAGRWTDMHEVVRRSQGGDPTDPANILLVCRPCHVWITEHPEGAVACGLAAWRWRA